MMSKVGGRVCARVSGNSRTLIQVHFAKLHVLTKSGVQCGNLQAHSNVGLVMETPATTPYKTTFKFNQDNDFNMGKSVYSHVLAMLRF